MVEVIRPGAPIKPPPKATLDDRQRSPTKTSPAGNDRCQKRRSQTKTRSAAGGADKAPTIYRTPAPAERGLAIQDSCRRTERSLQALRRQMRTSPTAGGAYKAPTTYTGAKRPPPPPSTRPIGGQTTAVGTKPPPSTRPIWGPGILIPTHHPNPQDSNKTHWGVWYHHTYGNPPSTPAQNDRRGHRAPNPYKIHHRQPAEYSAARRKQRSPSILTRQKIIPWDYDKSRGKQPRMTTGSYRRQRKTNPTTKITTTRTKRKETRERGGPSLKKPNATVECKNASGGEENAANCL